MSGKTRWDYLKAIYVRYQKVSKPLRARILDEFCQVCDYNRKYAIRLLNGPAPQEPVSDLPNSTNFLFLDKPPTTKVGPKPTDARRFISPPPETTL